MAQTFRHGEIMEILRAERRATVEGLAQRLGVTVQTIRRDLTELAEAGQLERVHGGAMLPSGTSNIGYEERRRLNAGAKAEIAAACAAAIPEGASLFLNIGTTTEAVARAIVGHRGLLVVTNNLNAAAILAANADAEVVVAGGVLRRMDGALVGDLTTEMIAQFKVDIAVIGASAIDGEGDLLDFDLREVRVSRAILRQARRAILVADASKFARLAPVRIGSLADVQMLVTDLPIPEAIARRCAEWGTEIRVTGRGQPRDQGQPA